MTTPQANSDVAARAPGEIRASLFRAITVIAGPAQAQRRTVQLGSFQQIIAAVLRDAAQCAELRQQGVLTEQQAELIEDLRRKLTVLRDGRNDYLSESKAAPREFLWSDALEDEEWTSVRHLARRCFTLMKLPLHADNN